MKVLFVKAHPKLTSLEPLCLELKDRGLDVHVLLPWWEDDLSTITQRSIPVHTFDFSGWRFLPARPLKRATSAAWRYACLLRREKFDIVHLNLPSARVLGRLTSLWIADTKVVSVIHGFEKPPARSLNVEKITARWDAATVCVSEAVKKSLPSESYRNLVTIHNALSPDFFKAPERSSSYLHRLLRIDTSVPIIGMVAYFYQPETKGHEVFLRAAKQVLNFLPDAHFCLIGDNLGRFPCLQYFQAKAIELGIGHRVHFLGQRRDIREILDSLSLHVLASPQEGFGLVMAEAMARAVPNIASDIETTREVLGDTGIFFEPGNSVALSHCMLRLLKNNEQSRSMGERGRQRAQDLFAIEKMADSHLKLFREVCI